MTDLKEVVQRVLLPLQLGLGIWQIMRVTPFWAVMRCTVAAVLSYFYLKAASCFTWSFLQNTNYNKLQKFDGQVFKKVVPYVFTVGSRSKGKKQKDPKKTKKEEKNESGEKVLVLEYLGKEFELQREEGNKMLVKDGSAYYITDKMWSALLHIRELAPEKVFLKDSKELWEEVITGDIMKFEEVLDAVILDNRELNRLDHDYFLPVNLCCQKRDGCMPFRVSTAATRFSWRNGRFEAFHFY